MNQWARDILVQAELRGQPQARGRMQEGDKRCALAVLYEAAGTNDGWELEKRAGLTGKFPGCPLCDWLPWSRDSEYPLVWHLNDVHGLSFLDIARKFPGGEELPE